VELNAFIISITDTYLTVDLAKGDILYKEKGSKFIGYVFPISNENEVKVHIGELKKKHHSARHWCYAWRLGTEQMIYRVNDDGEPNNSAGQPIYGQIISKNITNVLLVVVRYFGGTKLGVGGLITAYKTTAKMALDESLIVERTIDVYFQLIFEYKDMNKVMRIVKENNLSLITQKMELKCEFLLSVRNKNAKKVENYFKDLRCLKITKVNK